MYPTHISIIERRIINGIIRRALGRGFSISVSDGMEDVVTQSTDATALCNDIGHTDLTDLTIVDKDGIRLGVIRLIHGNDEDVVGDAGYRNETQEIMEAIIGDPE